MAREGSRHGGQSWTEELIAQNAANSGGEEEAPKTLSEEVQYPAVERKLRSWYYHWVSALLTSLHNGIAVVTSPVIWWSEARCAAETAFLPTKEKECKLMT